MKRILVIGDGQLGLMMAGAAARIGVVLDRLSPEGCVLYRGTGRSAESLPRDWSGADYDIVTVEREHLPDSALLERLREHPGFAAAGAVARIADRRLQKALLDELCIPTALWRAVDSMEEAAQFAAAAGGAAIVKAARGGYDGRGQWRVRTGEALPANPAVPMIAEREVPFRRELSLVGARFADGRAVFYPLVENHHRGGMLRATLAPARVDAAAQRTAEEMLGRVMQALDWVGVMAVELFDEDGSLLVNELAPRVHNSGHWSQAGAVVDQFELHLRALCGLPCPELRRPGVAAMLNLVGVAFDARWLGDAGVGVHWYGKAMAHGRKLGHLNLHADDAAGLAVALRRLLPLLDAEHAAAAQHLLGLLQARGDAAVVPLDRCRLISK